MVNFIETICFLYFSFYDGIATKKEQTYCHFKFDKFWDRFQVSISDMIHATSRLNIDTNHIIS